MSEQEIVNFFEHVGKDNRLKDKIRVLESEAMGKNSDEVNKIVENKLIPLAKEAGFEFTMEDYKEFIEETKNKKNTKTSHGMQELDLGDLDNVSGGVTMGGFLAAGSTYACVLLGVAKG